MVVAKGAERIDKFEETRLSYRKASERTKREYRLYINGEPIAGRPATASRLWRASYHLVRYEIALVC